MIYAFTSTHMPVISLVFKHECVSKQIKLEFQMLCIFLLELIKISSDVFMI